MDEIGFLSALHRPGTLVDIGAHEGLLTLPLAALPGARVIAFEPLARARAALEAAVAGQPGITIRAEALGDAPGHLDLSVPVLDGAPQWQWASTAKTYAVHESSRVSVRRERVPVIPLDSLGLRDVTAIKLDAEGAEYAILRGAREILRHCRPLLTLELEERHAEGCTWAVPAFLNALGYEVCFAHQGRWHPVAALHRPSMQRASPDPSVFEASDPYIFNFFAWPVERAAEARALLPG
ncbi:FkbM family methyltransferase [Roseomonas sp. SSH11]|uniref:FkbM family methyltransferase n=1 Tax=Pararoseomonas baculiformis TaxID=2820812 RepID=A0ABS4AI17_9PROT|nr:FkbM family methyltransferase [Pararoseomonas baculiformis]MBP0446170.1 FkbM family methyltransferase [Pararoseomonas baculiformis]